MNRIPSELFLRKNVSAILISAFGELKLGIIVGIVVLIITLDWFSGTLNDLLSKMGSESQSASEGSTIVLWDFIKLVGFPLILIACCWIARKSSFRLKTNVREMPDPRRVEVLILFLSPPGTSDTKIIEKLIKEGGRIADKSLLQQFKGSWRMPLEAIAYHLYRLKKIVVIATEGKEPEDGTLQYFEQFRDLVNALISEKDQDPNSKRREILLAQDLDLKMKEKLEPESFKKLNHAVNEVFSILNEQHRIKYEDIMVDITGGTKICTVAGAIVSLGRGKRFQYVNRETYQVIEYDINIEPDKAS